MIDPIPPVSAVADVLALRGHDGWLTPPLAPVVPCAAPRVGRVVTVQLTTATDGPGLAPLFDLLSGDLPDRLVLLAGAEPVGAAVWGEILSAAAAQAGACGVIVDGAVRDRPAMAERGLPVYARREAVVGPNGTAHVSAVGTAVSVAGVRVAADDHIVFDATGCVRVPSGDLATVLAAAARYTAAEADVVATIEAGVPLRDAYHHKRSVVESLRG